MHYTFPEDKQLYELARDGISHLPADRTDPLFVRLVFGRYQELLYDFNMQAVPLSLNTATQTIQFLPAFLHQADDSELAKWRGQFVKSYDVYTEDKCNDDIYDDVRNLYPVRPDLPYRVDNSGYAQHMLCTMLSIPQQDPDDEIDDYGWIENRRGIFYENITFVCDRYCLPRLPIKFDTAAFVPRIMASPNEIQLFASLSLERYAMMNRLDTEALDLYHQDIATSDNRLSSDERHQKLKELGQKRTSLITDCQIAWREDNTHHKFPSSIDGYPIELVDDFQENQETSATLSDVRDATNIQVKPSLFHPN